MANSSSPQNQASPLPFGPGTLVIGAGALALFGLTRKSLAGTAIAAAGGVLAWKAAKAQSSSQQDDTRAVFLVNASPEQAYQLWRNFENLPRFMAHLHSVRTLDGNRSEWVAVGPLQRQVRWSAEITDDTPDRRISWRSLPGSDVQTSGTVEFRTDPLGRGTFIAADVNYSLPGGAIGTAVATLFGKHPEFVVREDVRRFKALLEAGEVATTAGQTHGPRGIHGRTEQALFRETSNRVQPQANPAAARSTSALATV